MDLTPETAALVAEQVKIHRSLLGVDSATVIRRSALAELAEAHRQAVLRMESERARADKAERRAGQMTTWWAGVSQQLRNVKAAWQAEKHARECDTPDDCRH